MGDRRLRKAALPAPSARSVKVSSSCSPAAPASAGAGSFESASSSTAGRCCSKSGEITCVERVSKIAACLSLAVSNFLHNNSARMLSASGTLAEELRCSPWLLSSRELLSSSSTLPTMLSTVSIKPWAAAAILSMRTSRAFSILASTGLSSSSSSSLPSSLSSSSSSSAAATAARAMPPRTAFACQAPFGRVPEAGRSGGWRGANVASLRVASLRVAPVKLAALRSAPVKSAPLALASVKLAPLALTSDRSVGRAPSLTMEPRSPLYLLPLGSTDRKGSILGGGSPWGGGSPLEGWIGPRSRGRPLAAAPHRGLPLAGAPHGGRPLGGWPYRGWPLSGSNSSSRRLAAAPPRNWRLAALAALAALLVAAPHQ
eukprot:scaffold68507_cov63-Phaeocystis_antarctica.AAC.1